MVVLQHQRPRRYGRLLAHALRECHAALCRALLKAAQGLLVLHGYTAEIGDEHFLRQIILRRAKPARRNDAVRARVRNVKRGAQPLRVVADDGLIVRVQSHVCEFPCNVLRIRVHDAAHEQLRAHADDFNDHKMLLCEIYRDFLCYFTTKDL